MFAIHNPSNPVDVIHFAMGYPFDPELEVVPVSRGDLAQVSFFCALSTIRAEIAEGRSMSTEALYSYFLKYFGLTDWDADEMGFYCDLDRWINAELIPMHTISIDGFVQDEIHGIDLELLGKLFVK